MSDTKRWDGPPLEAWSMAWTPDEAAAALNGVAAPWAVAGGWALDLWLGHQTRDHEDLEIAVPALFFPEIQARLEALGLTLFYIDDAQSIALAPGETPPGHTHQTWAADLAAQAWRLDVFREPGDADTWIYRRTGQLSAPRAWTTARTAAGVPYTAPHVALLFKAKNMRPKDEADFTLTAPLLDAAARAWLAAGLQTLHPNHPWIDRLSA